MVFKTGPKIKIDTNFVGRKRDYIINFSKENIEHMLQGYPDVDCLYGRAKDGCEFYIFENPVGESSKEFKPMPKDDGYFIYFGVTPTPLPENFTREDFDKAAQQHYTNLENKLRTVGKIPIKISGSEKELIIGYVTLNLEK